MLWVGNSFFYYNNSMHGHVGQLLNAAGQKGNRSTSATISGSGINWHDMEAHFKPNAVGSYSFVGDNEVRFNTFERPFDATMMMDCSQCPIHPKLQSIFYEYAKKHSETLRKHGSEPIFFMSWAYSDVPAMTEQLAAEYIKAGQQNNALWCLQVMHLPTLLQRDPMSASSLLTNAIPHCLVPIWRLVPYWLPFTKSIQSAAST